MNQLWIAILVFFLIGGSVAVLSGGDSDYHGNDTEMCR